MHSAIYHGWLRHRRFAPSLHHFRYRVFMMYLDLAELDQVLAMSPFWSRGSFFPARFQRSDFLGDPAVPLDQAVRQRIAEERGVAPTGPVRMLANLRYFGVNKNPIACYYCFDQNEQLRHIVAEVNNLPWDDRHSYVLDCDPNRNLQRIHFDKRMHVSPFNPMDMSYHWRSNTPGQRLALHIETSRAGDVELDATLSLERREITSGSLAAVLWQYPWLTAKVVAAIYWQAARLWLKKVPIYDYPHSAEKVKRDVP